MVKSCEPGPIVLASKIVCLARSPWVERGKRSNGSSRIDLAPSPDRCTDHRDQQHGRTNDDYDQSALGAVGD